jgi:hypothetical protein
MADTTVGAGGGMTFQQSLEAQQRIHDQNMQESMQQTMFQDKKHKDEEAAKAVSDAVKDAHNLRMQMLNNIKSA